MTFSPEKSRAYRYRLGLAGFCATAMLVGGGAVAEAGQCPADKVITAAASEPPRGAATTPKDVTDTVIGSIDLRQEQSVGVNDRLFRLRRLVVQPGGIVPWHSHDERPAMIYVVSGEIVEYASNCAVPIVHKAGDVAPERNGISHWWQNHGKVPSKLISVDIFPVADKVNEKMM